MLAAFTLPLTFGTASASMNAIQAHSLQVHHRHLRLPTSQHKTLWHSKNGKCVSLLSSLSPISSLSPLPESNINISPLYISYMSSQLPHAGRALALLQLWRSDMAADDEDDCTSQEAFQVIKTFRRGVSVVRVCLVACAFLSSPPRGLQFSSSHLHALLHLLLLAPPHR